MKKDVKARIDEGKLVNFARSYLAEEFPNPERIGCPAQHELLAERPSSSDLSITEHLGSCSPCFTEYQELLRQITAGMQPISGSWSLSLLIRRSVVLATGIGLTTILLSISIWVSHKREIVQKDSTSATFNSLKLEPITVEEFSPFLLDMSNATHIRGQQHRQQSSIPQIPRKPLRISAYLPIGSDAGDYSVSLNKGGHSVWSGVGKARLSHERIVMEFQAEFTSYRPGHYALVLVSKNGLRLTQQIVLQKEAKTN